jgi:hypothetical protein
MKRETSLQTVDLCLFFTSVYVELLFDGDLDNGLKIDSFIFVND